MGKVTALALLSVLILGAGKMLKDKRGYRNNNPGNIRASTRFKWDGEIGADSGGFVIFSDVVYGYRALAKLLTNYGIKYGADTIAEILPRYAPSTENNTEAYIRSVSLETGLDVNESIDTDSELLAVMQAISKHENGYIAYSDEIVKQGIALA